MRREILCTLGKFNFSSLRKMHFLNLLEDQLPVWVYHCKIKPFPHLWYKLEMQLHDVHCTKYIFPHFSKNAIYEARRVILWGV